MRQAPALGTRDAGLEYHAGMIARALRDAPGARAHLEAALDINPRWHPTQPAKARAALERLPQAP